MRGGEPRICGKNALAFADGLICVALLQVCAWTCAAARSREAA
jgi:hypothetical protein